MILSLWLQNHKWDGPISDALFSKLKKLLKTIQRKYL